MPEVGWALGDGKEHDDDPSWDAVEAQELYDLLEYEVIPDFYTRDDQGIPVAWVARMRESMARLTTQFSANRAVREYTEKYYVPAAAAYRARAADQGAAGKELVDWQHALEEDWPTLQFGDLQVASEKGEHKFEIEVHFGRVDPAGVRVELYADGVNGEGPERREMRRGQPLPEGHGYLFRAQVPATRPASDYTARVVPQRSGVAVPLEAAQILWQR
jgi:starch phosphorylase